MRVRLLALALVAGCQHAAIVVGELQEVAAIKAIPNPDLDLLFVIDNSASTIAMQARFADAFPRMIDALEQLDGPLPNLHIGVITSDMGTLGSASPTPAPAIGQVGAGGCANRGDDGALRTTPAVSGTYISDLARPDGTRERNYTGELRDAFGQLARVGAGGCGFEQPLAAMRRALMNPANAGFLRPQANLAIVILADEDDCSVLDPRLFGPESPELGVLQSFRCTRFGVTCDPDDLTAYGPKQDCAPRSDSTLVEDIAPFVDALIEAKGDPRRVLVAAAVGDPEPFAVEPRAPPGGGAPVPALAHSCLFTGPMGPEVADPAVRLAAFVESFPGRGSRVSICGDELAAALDALGTATRKLVGDPCLDETALIDTSADPGLQPACEVVDVLDSAPSDRHVFPGCADGAAECYELSADAIACPATPEHLRLVLRRQAPPTDDTWTYVRCQLHR